MTINKNTVIVKDFYVPYYSSFKKLEKFANDIKTILENLGISYKIELRKDGEIITNFEEINFKSKSNWDIINCFKLDNNMEIELTECSIYIKVNGFADYSSKGIRILTSQDITVRKLENYENKLNDLIIQRDESQKIKKEKSCKGELLVKELKNNTMLEGYEISSVISLEPQVLIKIEKDSRWVMLNITDSEVRIHNRYKNNGYFSTLEKLVEDLRKDVEFYDYVNTNIIPFIENLNK